MTREKATITKRLKNSTRNYPTPPTNGGHGELKTPLHPLKTQSPSTRPSTTNRGRIESARGNKPIGTGRWEVFETSRPVADITGEVYVSTNVSSEIRCS